jgi:hypothetical protein
VPIVAVLMAIPFWRALGLWLATLVGLAAVGVLLSMAQRPFYGKAPSLDQAMNFVVFFQFAALSLWLPALLGLATGARRLRGVAPITFAGLLGFGLAPLWPDAALAAHLAAAARVRRHRAHRGAVDRIASRWRLFGPVTMIAAPDVVARTVDPGDFLRFAVGTSARASSIRRTNWSGAWRRWTKSPTPTAATASTSSAVATAAGRRRWCS